MEFLDLRTRGAVIFNGATFEYLRLTIPHLNVCLGLVNTSYSMKLRWRDVGVPK